MAIAEGNMEMTVVNRNASLKAVLAVTLATAMCPVATAAADEVESSETSSEALAAVGSSGEVITDWAVCGTCEWRIDGSGCLIVRPADGAAEGYLTGTGWSTPWWFNRQSTIKAVRFEGTCHVEPDTWGNNSCADWFSGCSLLKTVDLTGLDTSKVTNMTSMFEGCTSLGSINLSGLDTSSVTDMTSMFQGCSSLASVNLSGNDVSKVVNMTSMFEGCTKLATAGLARLNATNVESMSAMFSNCASLASIDLSDAETPEVMNMNSMFYGCSSLKSVDISALGLSNVTDMASMFKYCTSLGSIDLSGMNASKVTDMSSMFYGCVKLLSADLSGMEISNVTDMASMFHNCAKLDSVKLAKLNAPSVVDVNSMFRECSSLTSIDLSWLNATEVEDMGCIFYGCSSLETFDFSNLSIPKLTDARAMFSGCTALKSINLSSLGASKAKNMQSMFAGCTSVAMLDFSGVDTSNAENMESMFSGCTALNAIDLSGMDTTNVANMHGMFDGCSSLRKVSLGEKFSFEGSTNSRLCNLPSGQWDTPTRWISSADGKTYLSREVPNNVAATYRIAYPDVDYTQWYAPGVMFCSEKGLITGYTKGKDAGKFGVGDTLTRAQLAAILWRNAEPDAAEAYDSDAANTTGMADVADNEWYTGAANWAVKAKVINGVNKGDHREFCPNDPVTAEQLAAILANYSDPAGAENADLGVLNGFADSGAISDWARGSVAWAKSKGIINGYDEGGVRLLKPQEEIARERVATILMNAFESGVLK